MAEYLLNNGNERIIEGESVDVTELDSYTIVNNLLDDLGKGDNTENISVKVYKHSARGSKKEYCFETSAEEKAILERIKHDFGAGDYSIWIYVDGKLKKKVETSIADDIKNNIEGIEEKFSGMVKNLIDQQQRELTELRREMLINNNRVNNNSQESDIDKLLKFVQIANALNGNRNNDNGVDKIAEAFTKGLEMSGKILENIPGTQSDESEMMSIFSKSLEAMIEKSNQNPINDNVGKVNKVNGENTKENIIERGDFEMDQSKASDAVIGQLITEYVGFAKRGKDPSLCAEWLWDEIPNYFKPRFLDFLRNEKYIDLMIEYNPEVINYTRFFEIMKDNIFEIVEMEKEAEKESEKPNKGNDKK